MYMKYYWEQASSSLSSKEYKYFRKTVFRKYEDDLGSGRDGLREHDSLVRNAAYKREGDIWHAVIFGVKRETN